MKLFCIIAGATGSGKSVCINTIVMSIVLNARPDEIKLLMVDPKKVELTPYTALPHMLAPVITEPRDACAALNWLVKKMEKRYEILKKIGVRNIDAFNTRKINKEFEDSDDSMYKQAMDVILGTGNASTTFLQRKLKIGYARAASLIDQLEARGVVGPAEGAKPRQIFAPLRKKPASDEQDLFDEDS